MKKGNNIFNLLVVLSMLMALFAAQPAGSAVAQDGDGPQIPQPLVGAGEREVARMIEELSQVAAINKIDPALRTAAEARGKEQLDVFVSVVDGANVSDYLVDVIKRPAVFGGLRTVFGRITAADLLKLAQLPTVVSIADASLKDLEPSYDPEMEEKAASSAELQSRMDYLKANELSFTEAQAKAAEVGSQGWFDVLDGHKSAEAWKKGFDGDGVILAVVDDGVDFAHPDLMGTYAWVTDEDSPYYGWPMAFSQASTQYFAYDVYLGTPYIANGATSSRWADTQTTTPQFPVPFPGAMSTGTYNYQPLGAPNAFEYTFNLTSQSGYYKFGSLPERNLDGFYGHRVAVMVADEHIPGVYDTVYVDLDNDADFTDEKPVTKEDPHIYRDMDGDGYTDISGGILTWISDGSHVPPTSDWLWGVACGDEVGSMKACPDSGELLTFAGAYRAGYTHGTQCASNVAGQGVVSGGLTAQPFAVGGMVQGAARNVGVMDMGDFYVTFADEDHYLVAALGYDGVPYSGDEVQVATNSYGAFRQMWGSWGYMGRLLTALNLTVGENTVYVFSSGNEGPGYGPQEGDGSPTTVQVGSSTQYGTTNWDSIFSADQIVYGDPNSFFSKGPNRDGSSGLDVLANGGRGSGDEGINYYGFDGATSWATWGGTSRSAPVAGGNLALVFDAYKARYGEWPTWDVAKALLKSGATNSISSPFYQGGGVVNADRSTDLAAGIYGVYATPDEWQVGNWEGTEYLNFAKVAMPGNIYTKNYTVNNPSGYDITVDLSDGVMTLTSSHSYTFTTSTVGEESPFNFHSPDYLMPIPEEIIPADAELMVVRYVHPYDTFDPAYEFDGSPLSSWRMAVYNWTDMNGDGALWMDADGNGAVNHVGNGMYDNDGFERIDFSDPGTEVQEGEYVRMDYEFGGLAIPVAIRNPLERMADGYFFGFQHRATGDVGPTTFQIGVEFYSRADWSWLSLSDTQLTIPAESAATFEAQAMIPADAASGAYEGVIFMNDPGDRNHAAHETALPVVVNVIADLPDDGSVMLGGGPMEDTLYQNSWTYGYFNWYGGGWTGAGDWRHYFMNIDSADVENQNLLIHTSWQDPYPTDINTFLLGPTEDCASNGVGCGWPYPSLGAPWPSVFGPYTLWPIAMNEPFRSGATYPFNTATGGPDDWIVAPLSGAGLYEVALHNVLYSGEDLAAQFQVDVGTINMEPSIDPTVGAVTSGSVLVDVYTDTGELEMEFTPTIELPDMVASLSGGLTSSRTDGTSFVTDTGGCYDAFCSGNVYEPLIVDQAGATELLVHLVVDGGQDADMFLLYDSDDDGVAEPSDTEVGSSGNSAGTDEQIVVASPALGRYFIVIDGYDVDPDTGIDMDWWYRVTFPGPLPTEEAEVYSDTLVITQGDVFSQTFTSNERAQNFHVLLSGLVVSDSVSTYVIDDLGNNIPATITPAGDHHIMITPEGADYRLGAGREYTVYVEDVSVVAAEMPHLRVWWDVLNIWLSATHPDVHVSAIGAGETVSVTVHFQKDGWLPGDASMSARFTAGPSFLPEAFDTLVILDRTTPAPDALFWEMTESDRGPSSFAVDGYPTVLGNTGDTITTTLYIENTGDTTGTFYAEDYILRGWHTFAGYVYTDTLVNYVDDAFGDDSWDVIWYEVELAPGESSQIVFNTTFTNVVGGTGWAVPNYFDVYDGTTLDFYGEDTNYVYVRSFRTTGSFKAADKPVVAPSEDFTYTISLYNPSAVDQDILVTDTLPADVAYVSNDAGMTYDAGTHTLTWAGTLPGTSLSSMDMNLMVTADSGLMDGDVITNTAEIALGDGTPWAEYSTIVSVDDGLAPDLSIHKSVDRLLADTGTTLSYTIVVMNNGGETALGVEVSDMLPDGIDIIEASITGGATYAAGVLEWTGDLAAGASHTITFQATVNDSVHRDLAVINGAHATADNYPMMLFNSALTEIFEMYERFMPYVSQP